MFRVKIGEKSIHFDELNPDLFVEAAKVGTGLTWSDVYQAPAKDLAVARALLARIAEQLDIEAPQIETIKELLATFVLEQLEDLPDMYEDGLPLAEGASTTAG